MLFFEYEFIIVYKPSRTHVVVDVLSILLDGSKPLGVPNETVDASFFCRTYMDVRNQNLFRDKSNAKNSKPSSKT